MTDLALPGALRPAERAQLVDLFEDLLAVQTATQFEHWSTGPLQRLLPHGMMICGLAEVREQQVQIQKIITHDWPLAYFDALRCPEGGFYSPIMARWNAQRRPQLYDPRHDGSITHRLWLDVFHDFGLGNIVAYGQQNLGNATSTYFNFSRLDEPLSPRHARLLELLTPHMHQALGRALGTATDFAPTTSAAVVRLTPREHEVLSWMLEGKTNWEIAHISARSEHTIKHHVERILRKLQASNRAQAVAKALALKLLH